MPLPARFLYPEAIFRMSNPGSKVYLTFDDGPTPGVTSRITGILKEMDVPATFFCTGSNIEKNPEGFREIAGKGFSIANHGFSHMKGRKSSFDSYIDDVERGALISGSLLFRPPYGDISLRQYRFLKKKYRIVFWDLMPYDFDPRSSVSDVARRVIRYARPGSVIVLHDGPGSRVDTLLVGIIGDLRQAGYSFGDLGMEVGWKS